MNLEPLEKRTSEVSSWGGGRAPAVRGGKTPQAGNLDKEYPPIKFKLIKLVKRKLKLKISNNQNKSYLTLSIVIEVISIKENIKVSQLIEYQ